VQTHQVELFSATTKQTLLFGPLRLRGCLGRASTGLIAALFSVIGL